MQFLANIIKADTAWFMSDCTVVNGTITFDIGGLATCELVAPLLGATPQHLKVALTGSSLQNADVRFIADYGDDVQYVHLANPLSARSFYVALDTNKTLVSLQLLVEGTSGVVVHIAVYPEYSISSDVAAAVNTVAVGAPTLPVVPEDGLGFTGYQLVTVGTGGQFATINAALRYFMKLHPSYPFCYVIIQLLPGFVMAEQVLVNGADLSWIHIKSQNPAEVHTITKSALTIEPSGRAYSDMNAIRPAFYVNAAGKLPVVSASFYMDDTIGPGDAEWSFPPNHAMYYITKGSRASIFGKIRGASGPGIHCVGGRVDFYGVEISDCHWHAVMVEEVGVVNLADDSIISNIHKQYHDDVSVERAGDALYAYQDSTINAPRVSIDNCTGFGVVAYSSNIHIVAATITNCNAAAIYAYGTSSIYADSCTIDNCGAVWHDFCDPVAVGAYGGSIINMEDSEINNCLGGGIYAYAATIYAENCNMESIAGDAVFAESGSHIYYHYGWLKVIGKNALVAYNAATIVADGVIIDGVIKRGCDAQSASYVSLEYSDIINCGMDAVCVYGNSTANVAWAYIENVGYDALGAYYGSTIYGEAVEIITVGVRALFAYDSSVISAENCVVSYAEIALDATHNSKITVAYSSFTHIGSGTASLVYADSCSAIVLDGVYFYWPDAWHLIEAFSSSCISSGDGAVHIVDANMRDSLVVAELDATVQLDWLHVIRYSGKVCEIANFSRFILTNVNYEDCINISYTVDSKSKIYREGYINTDEIDDSVTDLVHTWSSQEIEGRLLSKAVAQINYYISNVGDDDNDGLTQFTPLLTVQAALNKISAYCEVTVGTPQAGWSGGYSFYINPLTNIVEETDIVFKNASVCNKLFINSDAVYTVALRDTVLVCPYWSVYINKLNVSWTFDVTSIDFTGTYIESVGWLCLQCSRYGIISDSVIDGDGIDSYDGKYLSLTNVTCSGPTGDYAIYMWDTALLVLSHVTISDEFSTGIEALNCCIELNVTDVVNSAVIPYVLTRCSFRMAGNSNISSLTPTATLITHKTLATLEVPTIYICKNDAPITITIQADDKAYMPVDTELVFVRYNANVSFLTIDATLNSVEGLTGIGSRYGAVTLKKIDTNEWILFGALGASDFSRTVTGNISSTTTSTETKL